MGKVAVLALWLVGPVWAGPKNDDPVAKAGKYFMANCAACHAVPDKSVESDRIWIGQLRLTKCTRAIKSMAKHTVEWINAQPKKKLPKLLADPPASKTVSAWVEPDFEFGSIVLAKGRKLYRLSWKAGDKDRRRVLRSGTYEVFSMIAGGRFDGSNYWLSYTPAETGLNKKVHPARHKLKIASRGKSVVGLRVLPTSPRMLAWARPDRGGLRLGAKIVGFRMDGISIYRGTRRASINVVVLDSAGATLKADSLRYSEEGRGWRYFGTTSTAVSVEFSIDSGPFAIAPETVKVTTDR